MSRVVREAIITAVCVAAISLPGCYFVAAFFGR